MIERWKMMQRQALPLQAKIARAELLIRQWYTYWAGAIYIAFSGGKDSLVLLDIVRRIYPDIPGVFVDTGLEYPEIRDFVKTIKNVIWLKPEMSFKSVIETYGYPVLSKDTAHSISQAQRHGPGSSLYKLRMEGIGKDGEYHGASRISKKWQRVVSGPFKVSEKCCDILKKNPSKAYEKETGRKPMLGMMASDSKGREQFVLKNGCNAFNASRPQSNPLSVWTEPDIWEYIKTRELAYCKIYDMGEERTGCIFCMFGVHMEKGLNRFQRMKQSHPKQWSYCMEKLGLRSVLSFLGIASGN